ncbi:hornerin-like [Planococcus citri]|uniref:hornerin-like n=1 Tax=Planococcus citri TaxID=170843 RepID=UPI0031F73D1E
MNKIFLLTVLCLVKGSKALPLPSLIDSTTLHKRFEPRDLTYDVTFGLLGTNENDGANLNPNIKIASNIHDPKTETVKSLLQALEEESEHADSEQQENILSLIQDFNNVLVYSPARYAKILLNDVWHTVDMGAFGTSQRMREVITTESFINKLKQLLWQILQLVYDYFSQEMSKKPTSKNKAGSPDHSKDGHLGSESGSDSGIMSPESDSSRGSGSGSDSGSEESGSVGSSQNGSAGSITSDSSKSGQGRSGLGSSEPGSQELGEKGISGRMPGNVSGSTPSDMSSGSPGGLSKAGSMKSDGSDLSHHDSSVSLISGSYDGKSDRGRSLQSGRGESSAGSGMGSDMGNQLSVDGLGKSGKRESMQSGSIELPRDIPSDDNDLRTSISGGVQSSGKSNGSYRSELYSGHFKESGLSGMQQSGESSGFDSDSELSGMKQSSGESIGSAGSQSASGENEMSDSLERKQSCGESGRSGSDSGSFSVGKSGEPSFKDMGDRKKIDAIDDSSKHDAMQISSTTDDVLHK